MTDIRTPLSCEVAMARSKKISEGLRGSLAALLLKEITEGIHKG
ncbi:MAG: hypothetical protein IFNCLDLE_00444 [Ignavibacteriaceae bacterium]|nr:hypothetical protein [Ignavibacteriaceae bacterium]WKZ72371.1 MAG: hypothetical protein QY308_12160 [Ignavibacteriaceae bacterium]